MEFLKQSDEILGVGEFSRRFKMLVKTSVPELWLRGEISNLKTYSSGHTYFTLKDEDGAISAVLFKGFSRGVSFPLREGMKILAYGEITIYEARGNYQIVIKAAMQDGIGDLARKFEELKKKLADEGIFDKSRKKQIPSFPSKVAVITSPTGAAIRDFCRILKRRNWGGEVYILPSRVQGVEAAGEIVSQIDFAQNYVFADGARFDLLVLMRGGGSLEDLWSFNEEIVARAVAACPLPTISAVGHEIDFTLSDFSADLRAETPSAAAEHISSSRIELQSRFENLADNIESAVESRLDSLREKLNSAEDILRLNSPAEKVRNYMMRLDDIQARLKSEISARFAESRLRLNSFDKTLIKVSPLPLIARYAQHLDACQKQLQILSVDSTLRRGFALATSADGQQISAAKNLEEGEKFNLRFADGSVGAIAKKLVD